MTCTVRIAHISDSHLLEDELVSRSVAERARLLYLSLLRPRVVAPRVQRLTEALARAKQRGFDQLVFTGDLTEEGTAAQFALLARVLQDSGIPASKVTLVPGNHDAYGANGAWQAALAGPLAAYRAGLDAPVVLGDVAISVVNTAVEQHWLLSHGAANSLDSRREEVVALGAAGKRTLFVQHHPPLASRFAPVQRVDGLHNWEALQSVMRDCGVLGVLHGHLHRAHDLRSSWLRERDPCNVFCAAAVVSARRGALRFYDVSPRRITPLEHHA